MKTNLKTYNLKTYKPFQNRRKVARAVTCATVPADLQSAASED